MSIRRRPDRGNKWELSVSIDGKRKRLLFDSKREALDVQQSGTIGDENCITIEDAIQYYYKNLSPSKSNSSYVNEKRYFNLMFHFLTEERDLKYLNQIRYGHMHAFQSWLQLPRVYEGKEMHLSPSTVNRFFSSIKAFFVHWVKEEEIPSSPCAHLKALECSDGSRRPMTSDEMLLSISKAPEWFKPTIGFIHLTGAPPSCISRLKWSDVDFDQHTLYLTRRKGAQSKWRRIAHPLTPAVSAILSAQKRHHEFVFSNESDEPLSAEWCSRIGNRAIREAGIKDMDVVLYCMRHALASDLTNSNVSMDIVRQILGHANIRTTQRYSKPETLSLERALKLVRGLDTPPKCHQEDFGETGEVASGGI